MEFIPVMTGDFSLPGGDAGNDTRRDLFTGFFN